MKGHYGGYPITCVFHALTQRYCLSLVLISGVELGKQLANSILKFTKEIQSQ
jgi:hypothetical protein